MRTTDSLYRRPTTSLGRSALLSRGAATLAAAALACGLAACHESPRAETEPTAKDPESRVSDPHIHENIALYLVHGPDAHDTRKILTLDEALLAKKAVVHETGSVNQLAIENLSDAEIVFVQAGDIVKGGQQDRVLPNDVFLGPASGRVEIDAFCVESGRWHERAGESARTFASSKNALSSKELKLAARHARTQTKVWEEVAALQDKLRDRIEHDVRDGRSETSLQLTLEHEVVAAEVDAYAARIRAIVERQPDAIGYVAAINGTINSAEVYASHDLLVRSLPKLATALATEALASRVAGGSPPAPPVDRAAAFMASVEAGRAQSDAASGTIARETDAAVYYEAGPTSDTPMHKSYLAK
jgi:hypothetical protein